MLKHQLRQKALVSMQSYVSEGISESLLTTTSSTNVNFLVKPSTQDERYSVLENLITNYYQVHTRGHISKGILRLLRDSCV